MRRIILSTLLVLTIFQVILTQNGDLVGTTVPEVASVKMDDTQTGPYNVQTMTTQSSNTAEIGDHTVEYGDNRGWGFDDGVEVVDDNIGNCPIDEPQVPVPPEVKVCDDWYKFTKSGITKNIQGGTLKDSIGQYAINNQRHKWSVFTKLCKTDAYADKDSKLYGFEQ